MEVKTLCLGILTLRDASGYDIRRFFEKGPFSHFHQAGFGSIYPALMRAADEGLVTYRAESQEGQPDKKVYTITPAGEAYLKKQLHQASLAVRIRSDYLVLFLFSGLIDGNHLETVFDEYLKTCMDNYEMLNTLDCDGVSPGQAFVRELGVVFYGSVARYLQENRERFLTSVAVAADAPARMKLRGEQS